ncbi:abaecin-like [Ceratina calcarata]|uniref:Abaecin-like n=1 Tax=Ceratina calcarata TaxID=156304 RepID=A0AAJ7ITU1_9HYME|nr:abaecin-like [Ceratina calcarata]
MRIVVFVFALFATMCSVFAYVPPVRRPIGGSQFPTFPGQGPFNPRLRWPYPPPRRMF